MAPLIFFDENMVVASFAPLGITAFARLGGETSSRGWIKDKTGKVTPIPRPFPEHPADYLFMKNIPHEKAIYLLPKKGLIEASAKPFHVTGLFTVMQIDTEEEESKEKTNELTLKIKKALHEVKIDTIDIFADHYIYLIEWQNKTEAYQVLKSITQISKSPYHTKTVGW